MHRPAEMSVTRTQNHSFLVLMVRAVGLAFLAFIIHLAFNIWHLAFAGEAFSEPLRQAASYVKMGNLHNIYELCVARYGTINGVPGAFRKLASIRNRVKMAYGSCRNRRGFKDSPVIVENNSTRM
jgi:hypothetical protein